jgi:hypothetical protein
VTTSKVGTLYFGNTNAHREFGIFVLDGYVFILGVSLVVYGIGEQSRLMNLIFNCSGCCCFFALSSIQLSAWKNPAQKINYREEYGVAAAPETFPVAQGAIAFVLGFTLMLDTCLSLLTIFLENKHKANTDLPVSDEEKTFLDHQLLVPEDLERNDTRLNVSQ